jgi:hypothetical protein
VLSTLATGRIFGEHFKLACLGLWLNHQLEGKTSLHTWIFALLFCVAGSIFILPFHLKKAKILFIKEGSLHWQIQADNGKILLEERIPLDQIEKLEFIIPHNAATPDSVNMAFARLLVILKDEKHFEMPTDFFPGIYKTRIITALREHIKNLEVVEHVDVNK